MSPAETDGRPDARGPAPAPGTALPAAVVRHLQDMWIGVRAPAYLRVSRDGRILECGGACERYGLAAATIGADAGQVLDVLHGLFPVEGGSLSLPMVEIAAGARADLHLLSDGDDCWVVFLDAGEAARRQYAMQQYAHDLALEREQRGRAKPGDAPAAGPRRGRSAAEEPAGAYGMLGRSEGMREVYGLIADLADMACTVLIHGETGTGKELVARALHFSGARKARPFVVMNCAGLSDTLINSQLFGHKRGAFTDAVSDQKGFFEAADGGTLLLDEIGDIPTNTQTRILRVLEQKEVVRIGETAPRQVDVRVLAATHRNLDEEVRQGRFRLDLLYRIRVARINLPPLRDRRQDIPLLAGAFLAELRQAGGRSVERINEGAMAALAAYAWPGNVRELRHALEFAVIRCRGPVLGVEHLPPEVTASGPPPGRSGRLAEDTERQRLTEALRESGGRRDRAAALLGMSRATLYRRMKACGLDPAAHPAPAAEGDR